LGGKFSISSLNLTNFAKKLEKKSNFLKKILKEKEAYIGHFMFNQYI
jgi:hypothetical protein